MLSISSRLGGTTYVDHKFISILVGTATVLPPPSSPSASPGTAAALVAGALAAVYPNLWLIDSLLFPEGLFALLTTSCILVAYRWRDRPAWWRAAPARRADRARRPHAGRGAAARPAARRAVDAAAPASSPLAARWRHLVLAGAACVVVLAPWTIRNATTFEVFVPLSTNGNELIMYANCEDTYSGRLLGFWSFDCQQRYRAEFGEPPGDEAQKASYWRDVGVDYARDHLGEVPGWSRRACCASGSCSGRGRRSSSRRIEGRDKRGRHRPGW